MADFRRQPEWQQPADRHTPLFDPVLTVRQLSRFEFSRRALTRIDHALVFTSPKGAYDAFLPPLRPSRSEVAAKRYTSVYEVDMGVHPFSAELGLPSDNDAFEFTAEVDLSWQVADPALFVKSGHRDVPALLVGDLQRAARPVTREFAIARSAEAEETMLRRIAATGPLGAAAGLRVTCTVRLRRDQENIDHQLRLQAIDHSATEQIRVAERGMEYDVAFDRRARQQDELQLGRASEYGRAQQELALQQQRWAHEQAMLRGRQEIELQKIEAEKIDFYQWHLQQGGVHQWALHLARHPEDSRLVMNNMREDQLRLIQSQMDLVRQLLSGDGAENYELEEPKKLALRAMSDILNQRLPGVEQAPPPLPEGAPDAPAPQSVPGPAEPGQPAAESDRPAGQAPWSGAAAGSAHPGRTAPEPARPEWDPAPARPAHAPGHPPVPGSVPGSVSGSVSGSVPGAVPGPGTDSGTASGAGAGTDSGTAGTAARAASGGEAYGVPGAGREAYGTPGAGREAYGTPGAPPPPPSYAPGDVLPSAHPGGPQAAPAQGPGTIPGWQPPPGYGSSPTPGPVAAQPQPQPQSQPGAEGPEPGPAADSARGETAG
ncbi:hypothetical protein [Streptomyces sp. NPDC020141]|uniref:hypothetical protein n=1 Tax=Streptomyces sp. NPDC020141 TaxID=3365065 RepID=UPI00379D53CB